jgi:bifunctional DNA-binding transcriptional regulator/antitoxin component of YhaV-PrlF toxin-antitoxin module
MATIPMIIKTDFDNIKKYFNSNKFITKIFDINENDKIEKINDCDVIIKKYFNVEYLQEQIEFNEYITNNLIPKIKNINVELTLEKKLVCDTDDLLIYKIVAFIDKPSYIKTLLADQSTVYYIKIYPKEDDKSLKVLSYIRKFIPSGDPLIDNDDYIINDDITINDYSKYDKINFSDTLLFTANTFLGEDIVNDIIIPFIYSIFDDFINKVINKRIKSYLKKKGVEVYSNKKI